MMQECTVSLVEEKNHHRSSPFIQVKDTEEHIIRYFDYITFIQVLSFSRFSQLHDVFSLLISELTKCIKNRNSRNGRSFFLSVSHCECMLSEQNRIH